MALLRKGVLDYKEAVESTAATYNIQGVEDGIAKLIRIVHIRMTLISIHEAI